MTLKTPYFAAFLLAFGLGCSSREVPAEFPAGSAASPQTPPGPLVTPVELASSGGPSGDDRSSQETDEHADHEHRGHSDSSDSGDSGDSEQTAESVYVCPMHPEVTSNEPGDCPKCGMTLEEQK